MAPTLQELRTVRADRVEQARLALAALKADNREDPSKWEAGEAENIQKLLKASEDADSAFTDLENRHKASNRISEMEANQDRREEPNRNRQSLGNGDNRQSNIITFDAASKKVMRSYLRQGGQLSEKSYDDAFNAYIRGNDRVMVDLMRARNAAAGMSSDLEERGGYFITPETVASEIIKLVDDEVFVQRMSRVIMLPNGTRSFSARTRRARASTFYWAGENSDLANQQDTSLLYGKRSLTPNYLQGSAVISRDLLRNVPSMEGEVMSEIASNAAYTLEPAFISGDGNMKPLGLMVASNDGISTGRDVTATGASSTFNFDDFVNMKYALKTQYRGKANWMLHRYVLNSTALLKDGMGQYLWQPSRQIGEPDRILGLPVTETEWMPYITSSGLYFALLGDFSWYWIVYELSMEMQRLIEIRARTNENEYLFRCKLDAQPMKEEAFVRGKRA